MKKEGLTVKEVIEALQKLPDQDAVLTINIKQHNQRYGKQVYVPTGRYAGGESIWIDSSYGGSITVHLPAPAIISKWPEINSSK